jgi:uncharacterized metal-binding protein
MVDLPKKKVGIVACSGEELAEGTVTRLAALKVLEQLRPNDTVTICLPLFLAGGEGDRAFARFYPTIAVDGCEERCAARATEKYSGKPAASLVVTDRVQERGWRDLGLPPVDQAGLWSRPHGQPDGRPGMNCLTGGESEHRRIHCTEPVAEFPEAIPVTCSCGSGIPIQEIQINGENVRLMALPLIFENCDDGKMPLRGTERVRNGQNTTLFQRR